MPKRLVLAFLVFVVGLGAEEWAPVPPEIWAIRSGPKGAVILEDRMQFRITSMECVYRVRVFAEEGRAAAEIPDLPAGTSSIKGRTVYPDGRQVVFNSRKDFAERKVEVGGSESKQKHLVAPGITSDCVMEVSWSEYSNGPYGGLPRRFMGGLYSQWTLGNPYPTKLLTIEVAKVFPLAWSVNPGPVLQVESKETSGYKTLIFREVPPLEVPPYGLRPLLRLPSLVVYFQPTNLGGTSYRGAEAYWKEAAESLYKRDYEEGISKGAAYRNLEAELLGGLPVDPAERAGKLLNRLNQTVANLGHATHAERAVLPKDFWGDFDPKDLGKAAKTRKSNNRGMQVLFYHLLKAAGFTPKIGKVVDRELALFRWEELNPWQFHHDLIGVDLPKGGIAWMDPTLRHASPGVVHPDYTGVPALQIDTATWKPSREIIPGRNPLTNVKKYTYALELTEDGANFDMQGEFAGFPEYSERDSYAALDAREQGKALRERIEKSSKNLVVSEATVLNAADPMNNVTWRVQGTLEREPGRANVVDPFPGMPWPLWVPSKLDQERKTAIVLPCLSVQVGVSRFKVPVGFKPVLQEELRKENEFGRVFWVASFDQATKQVVVTLRVEVNSMSSGADHWAAFRTYLGWIESACRRQVLVVKES